MEADSSTDIDFMEPDSSTNERCDSGDTTYGDSPRPVRIVDVNQESGYFELNLEALSSILLNDKVRDRPVVVLSIAGDFRKGKSFLLNFFVRYLQKPDSWLQNKDEPLKGFSWRGGSQRDTTGILMWSEPFYIKTDDGREVAVLLMDTQGAFDDEFTIRDSATVFALSTMTSSIQIFNILHNMQEDNLQVLDVFIEYGKLALETADVKPFQKLLFLIRDWSYPYEYDYGLEGGSNLLKKKLEIKPSQPAQLQRVRKNIRGCFSDIECFLMPHPGQKVATSPQFDGRISDISEEFVDSLEKLVNSLVSPERIIVKSIGGQDVTGRQLLEYFKVYINIFKGESIPEPKSMLEATAEANNLAALASAKGLYMESMEELCGGSKPYINPNSLVKKHEKIRQDALDCFQKVRKLGGKEFSESYVQRLENEIETAFEHYSAQNKSKNMFNALGSAFILLVWIILCYTVSKFFEFIFPPLSNLFYLFFTVSLGAELAYMGSKLTGTFPETVTAIDAMVAQVMNWVQQYLFNILQNAMEERIRIATNSTANSTDTRREGRRDTRR